VTAFELRLAIHATPGAKRTEAAGAYGDALRVRLAAPPVDGKANAALIAWAARLRRAQGAGRTAARGAGAAKRLALRAPRPPTCRLRKSSRTRDGGRRTMALDVPVRRDPDSYQNRS
jgi:hypothetical protein